MTKERLKEIKLMHNKSDVRNKDVEDLIELYENHRFYAVTGYLGCTILMVSIIISCIL